MMEPTVPWVAMDTFMKIQTHFDFDVFVYIHKGSDLL